MKKLIIITIMLWATIVFVVVLYRPKECFRLGAARDEFSVLTDRVITKDATLTDGEAETFMQLYNRNVANILKFNEFIKK